MNNDEKIIRQLIALFMDGKTTVDDEERLGKWFRDHKEVAADLEPYREMFAYFDAGMPVEAIKTDTFGSDEEPQTPIEAPLKRFRWRSVAAIAASIVVLFGVAITLLHGYFNGSQPSENMPETTLVAAIQTPDSVKATTEKTDTATVTTVPQKPRKARKHHHIQRDMPPTPPTYMALTPEEYAEGEQKVKEMLADMSRQEAELKTGMLLSALQTDQLIASAISDQQAEEEDIDTY